MRKIFLLVLLPIIFMLSYSYSVENLNLGFNTNAALTVDVIKQEVTDVQTIVGQWKNAIGIIDKTGISISNLLILVMLFLISAAILGVIARLLIQVAKFFTPDKIDVKLDKIEDLLDKYLIKMPISFIAKIRGITRKKE